MRLIRRHAIVYYRTLKLSVSQSVGNHGHATLYNTDDNNIEIDDDIELKSVPKYTGSAKPVAPGHQMVSSSLAQQFPSSGRVQSLES